MAVKRRSREEDEDDDDDEEEAEEEEAEEGVGIPLQKSKDVLFFPMFMRQAISGLSSDQIPPKIENRLRLIIRKVVEPAVLRFFDPPPSSSPSESYREGRFWLRFVGQIPSPIFTASKILADDGSPIRIELWDTQTDSIVRAGPLSIIKVQIVPLKGDFGGKDRSEGEFSANIVPKREGRRPLIVGATSIALREGVAYLGDVSFTDNSSWTWSRHFRLGARTDPEIPCQESINEAISSRFIVKDHRGGLYRKHYPPALHDEVWRLNKIAKDGMYHSRLASRGISTVKEFLCRHEKDPTSLREILGGNVRNRTWEAIVEHAASCPVNADEHESYLYTHSGTWLLFDCVCKLTAASFDGGQTFCPPHEFPAPLRLLLQDLKRESYKHMNDWTRVPGAPPVGTGGID